MAVAVIVALTCVLWSVCLIWYKTIYYNYTTAVQTTLILIDIFYSFRSPSRRVPMHTPHFDRDHDQAHLQHKYISHICWILNWIENKYYSSVVAHKMYEFRQTKYLMIKIIYLRSNEYHLKDDAHDQLGRFKIFHYFILNFSPFSQNPGFVQ